MYSESTPEFSISPCPIYSVNSENTFLSTVPLTSNLSPPSSYPSSYNSSSNSSSPGLSPTYTYPVSPVSSNYPASPVSPVSPLSPLSPSLSSDECEEFSMDQLVEIKKQLNVFPPPLTAMEFITKNSFEGQDGHIKRPSNNFILFRKIAHDQKNQTQTLSHYNEREWSQIIGKIWKSLTLDEKKTYKELGEEVASLHKEFYPDYKYQPKRDKAAWKHYTVPNEPRKPKIKGKSKVKQQRQERQERQEKPLEILTTEFPQLIPSNTISYSLPSGLPSEAIPTTEIQAEFPYGYTTYENLYDESQYLWNL